MCSYVEVLVVCFGLVFMGRVVLVKFFKVDRLYEVCIFVIYKILEWKKGSGWIYVKVVYFFWCDGECLVKKFVKDFLDDKEE